MHKVSVETGHSIYNETIVDLGAVSWDPGKGDEHVSTAVKGTPSRIMLRIQSLLWPLSKSITLSPWVSSYANWIS